MKWYAGTPLQNGTYLAIRASKTVAEEVECFQGIFARDGDVIDDVIYWAPMPSFGKFKYVGAENMGGFKPYYLVRGNIMIDLASVGLIVYTPDMERIQFWAQTVDDENLVDEWKYETRQQAEKAYELIKTSAALLNIPVIETDRVDVNDHNR